MRRGLPKSTLFPYTTLFRSRRQPALRLFARPSGGGELPQTDRLLLGREESLEVVMHTPMRCRQPDIRPLSAHRVHPRSEEHTSELQSQSNLVCRLLLEKKKP